MKNTKASISKLICPILLLLLASCSSSVKMLYPVKIDDNYGFINQSGLLTVEPIYSDVNLFSEGLAPVQKPDGSILFLDYHGKETPISTEYGPIEKLDLINGKLARAVSGGMVGFVNDKGGWVIPPTYKRVGHFSEGMAAVLYPESKEGAYIDESGKELFRLRNVTALGSFNAKRAYFVRNQLFGITDEKGQEVSPAKFLLLGDFDPQSGLARALDRETELYGFIDTSGAWRIRPQFPYAGDFSEGLALILSIKNNRYGYIDSRSSIVIEPQFLDAGNFSHKVSWVRTKTGYRYIDKEGDYSFPLLFDYATNFYGNLALTVINKEQVYINLQGRIVPVERSE